MRCAFVWVSQLAAFGVLATIPAAGQWWAARYVSADGWSATDAFAVVSDRHGDALLVWEACNERAPPVTTRSTLECLGGRPAAHREMPDRAPPGRQLGR
jgi:hypothetical protein